VAQDYSGKKAAEIVGITYRQLDYWARTDLVRPSVADAAGSGSRRRYSYQDLLELKVIKTLLDAGIRLESVREVFSYLREQMGEDIASAQLVISGGSAILVRDDHELVDVLKQGQFVMSGVLSLGGVQREVDVAIVDLVPDQDSEHRPAATGTLPRRPIRSAPCHREPHRWKTPTKLTGPNSSPSADGRCRSAMATGRWPSTRPVELVASRST